MPLGQGGQEVSEPAVEVDGWQQIRPLRGVGMELLVLKQSEFAIETDSTALSVGEPTTCYAPLLPLLGEIATLLPNDLLPAS